MITTRRKTVSIILVVAMVFTAFAAIPTTAYASYDDSTYAIEVTAVTGGTLENAITTDTDFVSSSHGVDEIKSLTVAGELNATDLAYIKTNLTGLNTMDLENVALSTGVDIPSNWMKNNTTLTKILLPGKPGDYAIGDSAFEGAGLVGPLSLPSQVMEIGASAFKNTQIEDTLNISSWVTSIGAGAFEGTTITELEWGPDPSVDIPTGAFKNASSLARITFVGAAPTVAPDAFTGVASGGTIYYPNPADATDFEAIATAISNGWVATELGTWIIRGRVTGDFMQSGQNGLAAEVEATDDGNGDAIVGTVTADADGYYAIPNLNNGNYTVSASFDGYDEDSLSALHINNADLKNQNLQLTKQAPEVDDVSPSGASEAISGDVVITFDEAMDTSVPGTVRLNDGSGDVQLTAAQVWSNGKKTVTIAYTGLNYSTAYEIHIEDFVDEAGKEMDPITDGTFSFDTQDPIPVDISAISGVTAPAYGQTPVTSIAATTQFTGSVTWSPADAPFKEKTVYTATITLRPKDGYVLDNVTKDFFKVAGASTSSNAAGSGLITATFPATGAAPAKHTVTFNANGGATPSFTTKILAEGDVYGALPTTSRTGYAFGGWFTAVSGGTKITEQTVFSATSDQSLYAQWTAVPVSGKYKVSFNVNKGKAISTKNKTVVYGKKVGALPAVKRTGYTFKGWFTAKSGGTKMTAASIYKFKEDRTLYAQWKRVPVLMGKLSKNTQALAIRTKAGVMKSSKVVGFYHKKNTFKILGKSGHKNARRVWYKISYKGKTAWVWAPAVTLYRK